MKDFSSMLKKSKSIKSTKRKNYFRASAVSFNSEKDDSGISINGSSPKPSNHLNTNNFSIYNNSFQKNNNKNNNPMDINSKNIIVDNLNNPNNKKNKSSIKLNKSLSKLISPNKSINFKIDIIEKNMPNQSINNSIIPNGNKNIINNNKKLPLRNTSANINSRNFSTVKEEKEQTSKNIEEDYPNESPNNNINNGLYKLQLFFEGKKIDLMINKNEKFKKLFLLIQKQIFPYNQITDYDILYKLKVINVMDSFNKKIIDLLGDLPNGEVPTILLRKKNNNKEKYNSNGTIITIENFPSLTDLAIDLNNFFKKETRESDFVVDYKKNNICKVIFNYPEKAFSLVAYLSRLKLKKQIYKRLKVNLDYKINPVTNINKDKLKSEKIMLPYLKKETIYNIKNKNIDFYMKSPIYKRKNIKLFLPNYFSFSKSNAKNKIKGEDILFLYKQKQKQKIDDINTLNNNIKIMSYIDKVKPIKKKSEVKNRKLISLFIKDNNTGNTPTRMKRNSVFKPIINIGIDIEKDNKINYNDKNNDLNNITVRSWSNIDRIKSNINNKKNILKNNKNTKENNNIKLIDNKENKEAEEKKNELNLIELLKEAKMSDESDDSSKENSSDYDQLNNKKRKKYLFKNKNKKFIFFNGLTKRERTKNSEYIGKKYD